jgi:RNase P subunit RPR2
MIHSDLEADRTRCKRCGELLAKHCRYRQVDICNKQIVELTCLSCGFVDRIFWQAWLTTTSNMQRLILQQDLQQLRQVNERAKRKIFAYTPSSI